MKVALLSPYPDITNFGLRTISAWLRAHGHETRFVTIPDRMGEGTTDHVRMTADRYPAAVVDQLVDVLRGVDLVGISIMTHYYDSARQVTDAVHARLGVPVVWGGFHASVRPEECLQHADQVVRGEGEHVLLELVQRMEKGDTADLSGVRGLCWKKDGEVVLNPPADLEQDLDRFPPPDWSLQDHWILHEGRVKPVTPELLREFLREGTVSRQFGRTGYQTMTGRGCPHACAYCGNSFLRSLYKKQRFVRYRSVAHVMAELEAVRAAFPFVDFMWLSDDSFFGRTLEDIHLFRDAYKARIGLPFYMLGSPGTITEEKYAATVEAGLHCIQVGIEHGSPRIQKLFRRANQGNEKILATARILAKYADRTAPPHYDVIYDVAYETLEDRLETLRLIAQLPKPYRLQVFTLVYYPGTALHEKAMADGLIKDEKAEIYDRMFFERHDSYANTLLFLARTGRFPHRLLSVLADARVAGVMTSEPLAPLGAVARGALKAVRKARKPDGILGRMRQRAGRDRGPAAA